MFFLGLGEDQYVIQVNKHKLADQVPKDIVNQALEDGQSVRESKRHEKIFPVSRWGIEGRLPFIPLSNACQVLGVAEVQFGEEGRSLPEFKGGRHQGKRVPVLDSDVIDRTIVNAGTQRPILLAQEEEPCACRG